MLATSGRDSGGKQKKRIYPQRPCLPEVKKGKIEKINKYVCSTNRRVEEGRRGERDPFCFFLFFYVSKLAPPFKIESSGMRVSSIEVEGLVGVAAALKPGLSMVSCKVEKKISSGVSEPHVTIVGLPTPIYIHTRMHVQIYIHTYVVLGYLYLYVYLHLYISIYLSVCECVCVCVSE